MSFDLPANAQILTTDQISNLQPGQRVFHSEWGEGIFRGKKLDADGGERFYIDNYRGDLVMRDLNGDLFLLGDGNSSFASFNADQTSAHNPERNVSSAVVEETDANDVFLNKTEDDLDRLSGQLNDNREDVVSIDSVKSYQTQTSDLLAKINREIDFTEGKLRKLKDLKQSLYTHLGRVGHFLNEGEAATDKGIFRNDNVDKAKTFLQKESTRFYEELKEEINNLKSSFGFKNKRTDI